MILEGRGARRRKSGEITGVQKLHNLRLSPRGGLGRRRAKPETCCKRQVVLVFSIDKRKVWKEFVWVRSRMFALSHTVCCEFGYFSNENNRVSHAEFCKALRKKTPATRGPDVIVVFHTSFTFLLLIIPLFLFGKIRNKAETSACSRTGSRRLKRQTGSRHVLRT